MGIHRHVSLLLIAAGVAISTPAVWADRYVLKDGRVIDGTMVRKGDKLVLSPSNGGATVTIDPSQLQEVKLTGEVLSPAQQASSQWTALQAQIAKSDDLTAILAMHTKFLETFGEAPIAAKARESLQQYQQYANDHCIRFYGQWIPAAERDRLIAEAEAKAHVATAAYQAGEMKNALATAKAALKADPGNVEALLVAAGAEMRARHWVDAKAYYDRLTEIQPTHGMAWNNMGVLSFMQKREAEGLKFYAKALQVAPENRAILDNVAEALHVFPGARTLPVYTDLARQFAQADTRMATKLAAEGLFRYGSTWITQDQRDRIAANKQALQNRMNTLQAQYNQLTATLATVEEQLKTVQWDIATLNTSLATLDYQIQDSRNRGIALGSLAAQRASVASQLDAAVLRSDRLVQQRTVINTAIVTVQEEAKTLKDATEPVSYPGIQRTLEPADMEHPPAPVPVNIPPAPALPATPAGR